MPLSNFDVDGTLTVDSILLNRAAFAIIGDENGKGGLVQLWADFDVRGEDRLLPSATGVIPYPRRITKKRYDFRLLVVGDIDQAGTPVADTRSGLRANLEYIRANVLAPVVSSTGTRAATLTVPGGSNRTADVHVLGVVTQSYHIHECNSIWFGTLQISVPGGRFV
ncbi:MAG: hypothetical protein LC687_05155 [Actinobacteria bacterium]|nr:hypothetical protein [Actinomycetota bacterium]